MENSKAKIVTEEMLPTAGQMDPCAVNLPPECRPILTTTLTNTRDLKPAAIKLKIWQNSNSTLLLLKGEAAMEPLLFEEEEKNKPAQDSGMEACFLKSEDDFVSRITTEICPKMYTIPKETNLEDPELGPKVVGCWYGAPVVFLPPVHNLPLGFAIDPSHAKTGKNIKEAIMAFFEIPKEDDTYDYLESPYINSWCKMMVQKPEDFAQTAVSLKQVRTSWMAIVQPKDKANVAHAHQATFAHMECLLMHRIFRDALIAGSGKNG